MKWFKSHLNYPRELTMCDLIVTDDNYMHAMDYERIHVRLNLYDIIPKELFQFYAILISGFIRLKFEIMAESDLPQDLKVLICKFYTFLS